VCRLPRVAGACVLFEALDFRIFVLAFHLLRRRA
jgi:hypothetical protein